MQPTVPATALIALGLRLQSEAHNVANAATEGFRPGRVLLEDVPNGQGVGVAGVAPGGRPASAGLTGDRAGAPPWIPLEEERGGAVLGRVADSESDRTDNSPAAAPRRLADRQALAERAAENAVDLVRELLAMARDQRAFQANARVVQTVERMGGYVLDDLA